MLLECKIYLIYLGLKQSSNLILLKINTVLKLFKLSISKGNVIFNI